MCCLLYIKGRNSHQLNTITGMMRGGMMGGRGGGPPPGMRGPPPGMMRGQGMN